MNICLLGDNKVGKSTLLAKLAEIDIGSITNPQRVMVGDFEYFIWDCPELNDYKRSIGAIVLFDISDKESYNTIGRWVKEYKAICPDMPVLPVGNKYDLGDVSEMNNITKVSIKDESRKDLVDKIFYQARGMRI